MKLKQKVQLKKSEVKAKLPKRMGNNGGGEMWIHTGLCCLCKFEEEGFLLLFRGDVGQCGF